MIIHQHDDNDDDDDYQEALAQEVVDKGWTDVDDCQHSPGSR